MVDAKPREPHSREGQMRMSTWIAAAFAGLAALAPAARAADDYPARPVRIVVGFGPGATIDVTARILAPKLAQIFNQHGFNQQFVVENKTGAGSNLAADFVAHAPKDGYTLLVGTIANTINAAMGQKMNHDFEKDFAPIALVATVPNILVVHPSIGVKSVDDLIKLARAKPDGLSYGSSGAGSALHLSAELFKFMTGIKMVHVPYAGSNQAVADLLTGRVQVMFSPASTVLPHVQQGKLIALASTQLKRASVAPELPTMEEAGLKGFDTSVWSGLMAPTGTPADIVDKLARTINDALKSRDVIEPLQKQGIDLLGGTPQEFADYVRSETAKWSRVVAAAGMKQ
jgi:tripartite-type tricarboxylate transporter receptor subunit TctC